MTSDQWRRVKLIFSEALDRPGSDRAAFVSQVCLEDPSLEDEVNRLLAADDAITSFLESPLSLKNVSERESDWQIFSEGQLLCERFKIIEFLGAGGMGQVYSAKDTELNQLIAIKAIDSEISSRPETLARFKQEVYAARKVTNPHVCRTFDLEKHIETPAGNLSHARVITFLTMELLQGQTLAERLYESGALPAEEVLMLGLQATEALLAAHDSGIIHCDLKPGNIFLSSSRGGLRAVLTDFGISKFILSDEHRTVTEALRFYRSSGKQMLGTLNYMAPEQLRDGISSPGTDLYSLGLVLYEALTNERLSHSVSDNGEIGHAPDVVAGLRARVPDVDQRLERVILGCLQSDPAARFKSTREVVDILKEASVNEQSSRAGTIPAKSERQPRNPLHRFALAAIVVSILLILLTVAGIRYENPTQKIHSLAVLPFQNDGSNAEINYICEGVTDALSDDLSHVSGLSIKAQSVVRRLQPGLADLLVAGRRLNVDAVVTGKVSKMKDRLELKIELIDVKTGSLVWGLKKDISESEIASFQGNLAREIAYHLQIRIDDNVSDRLNRQYRTNSEAYKAYLKGRYALADRTTAGFETALSYFQQAIEYDPKYAPAFGGLADCYGLMAYNRVRPTLTLLEKSKLAAEKALQIDTTLGEAYTSLAAAETLGDFNWSDAEEMYRRAIQLNPSYISTHTKYGLTLLTPLARHVEARAQLNDALRMDPESLVIRTISALAEYYARNYDKAIEEANEVRKKSPHLWIATEVVTESYLMSNRPKEALKELADSEGYDDDAREILHVFRGIAYAKLGQKQKALLEWGRAEAAERKGTTLHFQLAVLCQTLGKRQRALEYLKRAYETRQTSILFLKVDPLVDSLRDEPQFNVLLSDLHLL